MGILKPQSNVQQYGDRYTGHWCLAVPNVTVHPSTAYIPGSCYSTWHYSAMFQMTVVRSLARYGNSTTMRPCTCYRYTGRPACQCRCRFQLSSLTWRVYRLPCSFTSRLTHRRHHILYVMSIIAAASKASMSASVCHKFVFNIILTLFKKNFW